jgi:hypothetical protein
MTRPDGSNFGAAGKEPDMGTGRAADLTGPADPGIGAETSREVSAPSQRGARAGQVYEGEYVGVGRVSPLVSSAASTSSAST